MQHHLSLWPIKSSSLANNRCSLCLATKLKQLEYLLLETLSTVKSNQVTICLIWQPAAHFTNQKINRTQKKFQDKKLEVSLVKIKQRPITRSVAPVALISLSGDSRRLKKLPQLPTHRRLWFLVSVLLSRRTLSLKPSVSPAMLEQMLSQQEPHRFEEIHFRVLFGQGAPVSMPQIHSQGPLERHLDLLIPRTSTETMLSRAIEITGSQPWSGSKEKKINLLDNHLMHRILQAFLHRQASNSKWISTVLDSKPCSQALGEVEKALINKWPQLRIHPQIVVNSISIWWATLKISTWIRPDLLAFLKMSLRAARKTYSLWVSTVVRVQMHHNQKVERPFPLQTSSRLRPPLPLGRIKWVVDLQLEANHWTTQPINLNRVDLGQSTVSPWTLSSLSPS